jgi:hypothetical protein
LPCRLRSLHGLDLGDSRGKEVTGMARGVVSKETVFDFVTESERVQIHSKKAPQVS